MLQERVSLISGNLPILVIAPHGHDDAGTALIAEQITRQIDCYAIINRGWKKPAGMPGKVDYLNSVANCNDLRHCHEDVVRQEFLEPIMRYVNRILKSHEFAFIYYLHGMANHHRVISPGLDIVVGHGNGVPASYSCTPWRKNMLIHTLKKRSVTALEGSAGSQMAGWSKNNLNQFYRKWNYNYQVQTMQLEIIEELRTDTDACLLLAEILAGGMSEIYLRGNQQWMSFIVPMKY